MVEKYVGWAGVSFASTVAVSLSEINEVVRFVAGLLGLATGVFLCIGAYRKWRKGE